MISHFFLFRLSNPILFTTRCSPLFIRCIKANENKVAKDFDGNYVLRQLRCTGLLSTIEIRRKFFPIQQKFKTFADR